MWAGHIRPVTLIREEVGRYAVRARARDVDKTLRIIQAGIGGFGSSWASEVVPSIQGVRPVAYVDVSAAALERLVTSGLTTQERCFSSIEEAVATVDSDAVLVTTPANWHIPVAQVAIKAGKHVLLEKPFAPSVELARQAVDLARHHGVTLMVSQNYRFHPAVHAVQQLVSSGQLGKLYSIAVDFRKGVRKGAPRPGAQSARGAAAGRHVDPPLRSHARRDRQRCQRARLSDLEARRISDDGSVGPGCACDDEGWMHRELSRELGKYRAEYVMNRRMGDGLRRWVGSCSGRAAIPRPAVATE